MSPNRHSTAPPWKNWPNRQKGSSLFSAPTSRSTHPRAPPKRWELLSDIADRYVQNVACSHSPEYLSSGMNPIGQRILYQSRDKMQEAQVAISMHKHDVLSSLTMQVFQASPFSLSRSLSIPSISGNQRQLSGKALKIWSLWSILYVAFNLATFMGPFLISSGSHYRRQGR